MIGGQGEDSCGNSGTGETPQERTRRGGSAPARGKRSLARKSTAVSQAVQLMCLISSSFDHILLVTSQLFCLFHHIFVRHWFIQFVFLSSICIFSAVHFTPLGRF
ncbi:hypothetical protein D0440_01555 [Priestia megaterium]|nr:hypothetical protein D0440_01555 [Priestia megaterium]